METANSFGSGDTLGKYRFTRELGRGGMGVVYLVEDTLLGRDVALKLLSPALGGDEAFARRFREEARSIARIAHPNVVHVNSFESLDGHLAIDMEYVDGPSLNQFIADGMLSAERVVRISYDILQALVTCHGVGLVHRDVKPTNVLMTSDGRAKVSDFGVATAYASHMEAALQARASSAFYLGTPRYAPPEMWEGAQPSPSWDLYSVGMLMYEALTGVVPYDACSPYAIIKQIQTRPLATLTAVVPSVSRELSELVHCLLKHDLSERVAHAEDALDRLRTVPEFSRAGMLDMPTIRVPRLSMAPSQLPARRPPLSSRVRRGGVVTALAAVALFAFALYSYFGGVEDGRPGATASAPEPQAQETILQDRLHASAALLSGPKTVSNSAFWIFDTTILESGLNQESHWLMEIPRPGRDAVIVAASDRALWRLTLAQERGDHTAIRGDWAEYRDDGGTVYHHGTITGTGLWTTPEQKLTASLLFADVHDGAAWTWTVAATRTEKHGYDSKFIYAMEEKPLVLPLLYHELMPQRLPWAAAIEGMFPAIARSTVLVPSLKDGGHEFVLDGKLNESFWKDTFKDDGVVPVGQGVGAPFGQNAICFLRAAPDRLILGIRAPRTSTTPLSLDMVVLPGFSIPAKDSPFIVAHQEHGAPLKTTVVVKSTEIRYDSAWQEADTDENGVWTAELVIPYASVFAICPTLGIDPWRINLQLYEYMPQTSQRQVVYRWGFPDLMEALHGMKVSFETPPVGYATQGSSRDSTH